MSNKQKAEILEQEDFAYHFINRLYINEEKQKIFSIQAIEKNNPEWLKEKIAEKNENDEWQFYFIGVCPNNIKKEILLSILAESGEIKKLQDFVKYMCSRFTAYPKDGACHTCPTGEPYITYTIRGIKKEGGFDETVSTAKRAVEKYIQVVSGFLKNAKGTLYWRRKPTLCFKLEQDKLRYRVWSRFIISERPIQPEIMEKYFNA